MTLRSALTILGITIWAGVALTAAVPYSPPRLHSAPAPVLQHEDAPATNCSDLHFHFDHRDAVVQSEERTITKSEARTLRVTAEPNGGVQVVGWDQDTYRVTLCKAAEEGGGSESVLSQIHIKFHDGELSVSRPSSGNQWAAHLLIRTPKTAAIELSGHNGPVSFRDVDGSLKIRAENGPVEVVNCTGQLDLDSHNGPVTLEGNSGKQTVHTQNGPVTLSLTGDSWQGDGLEASATNGPINLQIPTGYKSGVILESDGHGPFQCRASVCSEGRKTWDEERKRIEFGSGPTLVRVSTVNGPVSVE
jgi:putative adhesin